MLRKLNFKTIFCLFVLVFPLTLSELEIRAAEQETTEESKRRTLKIASWNIQQLGQTKAGLKDTASSEEHRNNKTLRKIAYIIENMIENQEIDLIAIQEVQDANFKTLPELLKTLDPKEEET